MYLNMVNSWVGEGGNLHILPWDKAKHLSKMMSVIHQNLTVWLEINCMKKSALFICIPTCYFSSEHFDSCYFFDGRFRACEIF